MTATAALIEVIAALFARSNRHECCSKPAGNAANASIAFNNSINACSWTWIASRRFSYADRTVGSLNGSTWQVERLGLGVGDIDVIEEEEEKGEEVEKVEDEKEEEEEDAEEEGCENNGRIDWGLKELDWAHNGCDNDWDCNCNCCCVCRCISGDGTDCNDMPISFFESNGNLWDGGFDDMIMIL